MDKWIHGQGIADEAEYLVRTEPPRCIVQINSDDERELLAPLVQVNSLDEEFAVVMWLDPEPDAATHRAILDEAIAANEFFTQESMDE